MSYSSESKHAPSTCPSCGELFVCMANRPTDCGCNGVPVTPDEAMDIAYTWDNQCLCAGCLRCERDKLRVG